ncbi:ergothioneine biosynthesis glutamate--cysteine ligase EgtA [Streptomyces sp. ICBB 8177]|uniref:ergothioneine biosynthesis glutamate--cysteine ligase EgtA n=1 Tax=Streptomyces sp. ICBB 8177 TaxID=563922 RepID=UPI000D6806B1|nr:ergothioneine biosynthesis glutamate--cysteine ligase EgtA [Streptomyces sp. ICBB 8177]PWI41319.1 ergothioneine biosynthesis glutamate--cysteine ligase EgtA [Streptomyces sp. ICBB 8177]
MNAFRPIGEAEAEARAHGICFKNGPPRRVGVELEWLVHDARDPARAVAPVRLADAHRDLGRLPLASLLTQEPGGQLELSSPPAESLTSCVESMTADLAIVREALRGHELRLAGFGHEPWHRPRRVLQLPRYTAMEEYFDRAGPIGRSMMCSTASVQVCLDAGTAGAGPDGYAARWRLAHLLGPVLIAAFANSPLRRGRPTGVRSTRQAVWTALDPGRTTAPEHADDPRDAWARFALGAPVLCVRAEEGQPWTVPPAGLTFRGWIRGQGRSAGLRPPTEDDLAYHLTTLFPPVRPHGHLELRMIDAQPGDDGWIVPLAVTTALLDDPVAAEAAHRAVRPLDLRPYERAPGNPLWRRAARGGMTDPALRLAADKCFAAAREALPRLGASTAIRDAVEAFADRYVARGRCPADDLLDPYSITTATGRVPARTAPLIGKDGRS